MRAVKKIEKFGEETGEPMGYSQTGSLKIARTPEHEQQLRRDCEPDHKFGLDVDLIAPADGCRLIDAISRKRHGLMTSGIKICLHQEDRTIQVRGQTHSERP